AAERSGTLSLAFFDAPFWDRFGGLSDTTYRTLAAETGIPLSSLVSLRESMGFARPDPDDAVREDELAMIPLARMVIGFGADPVALDRNVRIWGDSLRRIAEADSVFYRSQIERPLLQAGMKWSDMLQAAAEASTMLVPFLDPALLAMYHAQSEHTW